MILAPILISFSIGLVSDGSLIGLEKERRVKHPPARPQNIRSGPSRRRWALTHFRMNFFRVNSETG
jgi:hypothetical protein